MAAEAKILLTAEDKTRAAFESAKRGLQSMDSLASAAGLSLAALGGAVTLAGLVTMVKRVNDNVDALNDLADATGASIENISGLERVAKLTGASIDTVGQALVKYNQALGTTLKPGSDAEKVLGAIGLNAKALRDIDPAEALRQTAVALNQFADDGNKARAVQELFGKSLKEVAPFLKDLAEQGELQATVTTKQALEAEKFNKELFKMQAYMDDVGRAMANPMVSGLNALIERFALAKKEGDGFLVTLLKQTEIARLLGMNKSSNGYSDTRRELELLSNSLLSGNLNQAERAMAEARQAELLARLAGYLNSTAGAGRGVAGYGDLPKGSLELPADIDKKATATKGLTEAEKAYNEERKRGFEVVELRNRLAGDAEKARVQALAELNRTLEDYAEASARGVAEAVAAANQAEAELAAYGLLKSAVLELTLAQLEQSKELAALAGEDVSNIERRIDAQNRLIAATRGMEVLDANKKAAEDADREWQKASDQIEQSLTNALMSGGKNGADYIKDLFRTMVLRPLLQPVASGMAGVIGQLPGAAGGGSGVLGQVGQMVGMANFAGMSTANAAGSMFANATGGGLDALLATNGAYGTAAGAGAGLMSGLSKALPWVGGALAIASLLDNNKGGPKTIGGASDAATIQATVAATLAQFGVKSTGLRVGGFSAADPAGDSLTQLQTALFRGDTALYSRQDRLGGFENVGRSSEELAAAWAEETARITLAALQATLEPKYQQYLREVDANTSSADAINAALARLTTARTLEERLLELSSTEAENLARARARELDAMDETLRPLLRQIQAQEDLKKRIDETNAALLSSVNEAYEAVRNARGAEVSQLDATVTRLRDYGRTLREFRDGLLLGNLSTLTPGQRLEEARRQLENVAGKARTGDVNAQGQVQGLVSAFLEASATYNASGAGFTSDFAYTQALLTELADSSMAGADVAQLQLDALGVLNQSVLTIPAALTSLAGAITTAIGAGLNPGAASIGALAGGLTGERIKTDAGSVYASASGAASLGNVVYTKNGKTFTLQELQNELIKAIVGGATSQDFAAASAVTGINRADALAALAGTGYESRLPAFRNGGSHMGGWAMVGEGGPELAYMPPARVYSNADTRQIIDIKPLIDRIQSLESTVTDLGRALVAATYDATARAADKTVDGMTNNVSRASFAQATVPVLA